MLSQFIHSRKINMVNIDTRVTEYTGVTREIFEQDIAPLGRPAVLKGAVAHWPVVSAATQSNEALGDYLKQHDSSAVVETFVGKPEMKGRYFYNADMTGFNFEKGATTLSKIVDQLLLMANGTQSVMIYAGSAPSGEAAPRFAADNPMPLLNAAIEPRLWLGNASRVAAHYDNSRNIACCIAGNRRFTVFPPDQIGNLYLGPLDFTMAGPPASMVDFAEPDYDLYPRFRDAEKAGMIADLQPGDAIYLPSLWWHHVEAKGPFNLLANYWWKPANAGSVFEAVMLALVDLRDQPAAEKEAWRAYFEHFVFGEGASVIATHLPAAHQNLTGPKSPQRDRRILEFIIGQLSARMTD
jgi:Cupin-like domain